MCVWFSPGQLVSLTVLLCFLHLLCFYCVFMSVVLVQVIDSKKLIFDTAYLMLTMTLILTHSRSARVGCRPKQVNNIPSKCEGFSLTFKCVNLLFLKWFDKEAHPAHKMSHM